MRHLDRFNAAVSHKETDRPPADFIAHPDVMKRMAAFMGVRDEEEVLGALDVDIRHISQNDFRPAPQRDETGAFTDIWGDDTVNHFGGTEK